VDKRRVSATQVESANIIGAPLKGKVVVIFDDMISTAGSVTQAARVAREHGCREVYVCATHGVLCGDAIKNLRESPIKELVITDSIPLTPEKQLPIIRVQSVASLLADAIKRIHFNESVSQLFE
jgi:ribose-phosphate pyrophosphokinase